MNAEIVARLEQSFFNESGEANSLVKAHIGTMRFFAECLEELAALVPPDAGSQEKVQLIMRLSRAMLYDVGRESTKK